MQANFICQLTYHSAAWSGSNTDALFTMDNSNSYTKHTIIVWKMIILNYRLSLPDLAPWLTLIGSNYPYLEQISMVP